MVWNEDSVGAFPTEATSMLATWMFNPSPVEFEFNMNSRFSLDPMSLVTS